MVWGTSYGSPFSRPPHPIALCSVLWKNNSAGYSNNSNGNIARKERKKQRARTVGPGTSLGSNSTLAPALLILGDLIDPLDMPRHFDMTLQAVQLVLLTMVCMAGELQPCHPRFVQG